MTAKRRRVVLKKPSKGACRTCRSRRVKCDETRPCCNTCAASGRSCEGFSPGTSSRIGRASVQPLKPTLRPSNTCTVTTAYGSISRQLPVFDFSLTIAEREAFQYFVHETAPPLQLIIPARDWTQLALQISLQVPALFHAITAVGSITDIPRLFDQTLHRPEPPAVRIVALQQYSKATSALQKYIYGAVNNQASIEPVLLCCILFSIFETIQLSSSVALSHLRFGIAAVECSTGLNRLRTKSTARLTLKPTSHRMTEELFSIFCKLDAESIDVGQPRLTTPEYELLGAGRLVTPVSTGFTTTEQAKQVLDEIVAASSKVVNDLVQEAEGRLSSSHTYTSERQAIQYCMACCASRAIQLGQRSAVLNRKEELRHAHRQWSLHVSRLENHQSSRRFILMKLQHFLSCFKLATCREPTDQGAEQFTETFEEMLDLIVQYCSECGTSTDPPRNCGSVDTSVGVKLDRRNLHWPFNTQNSFSLEHAILPVLFLTCLKCRSARTKSRALAMLDGIGRREGIYWSGELAVYAEALIDLQQRRSEAIAGRETESNAEAYPILEASSFADIVIEGLGYHEIRIICGHYQHEQDGEMEIVEYRGFGAPPLRLEPLRRIGLPKP